MLTKNEIERKLDNIGGPWFLQFAGSRFNEHLYLKRNGAQVDLWLRSSFLRDCDGDTDPEALQDLIEILKKHFEVISYERGRKGEFILSVLDTSLKEEILKDLTESAKPYDLYISVPMSEKREALSILLDLAGDEEICIGKNAAPSEKGYVIGVNADAAVLDKVKNYFSEKSKLL